MIFLFARRVTRPSGTRGNEPAFNVNRTQARTCRYSERQREQEKWERKIYSLGWERGRWVHVNMCVRPHHSLSPFLSSSHVQSLPYCYLYFPPFPTLSLSLFILPSLFLRPGFRESDFFFPFTLSGPPSDFYNLLLVALTSRTLTDDSPPGKTGK